MQLCLMGNHVGLFLPALNNKPYEERLKILKLPTLKFCRQRGAMIETYKILAGIYDNLVTPNIPILSVSRNRGNSLKIVNRRCHYDLRKYSFCNRITNVWNSLPEDIPLLTLLKIDLINSGPGHRNLNTSRNNWNRKQKSSFIVKIFKVFATLITYYL